MPQPLADRLRPQNLADVFGQNQLLAPDAPLGRMVAAGHLSSIILWGPPGCGKTTIARLLADNTKLRFVQVSAVASGIADLRAIFEQAQKDRHMGQGTALFIDEIHRFNRAQQDVLLPYVEEGVVTLIGATTENPSFELNSALLSRCQVLVLNRLDSDALEQIIMRAEQAENRRVPLTSEARAALKDMADGDGRYFINMLEQLLAFAPKNEMDTAALTKFIQRRLPIYDKKQDSHYNLISALHKSMRGSDPDAALYWFARMLEGGEDPVYIARRMVRFAVEDIGLAQPHALTQAVQAWQAYERLGSPEGELALAQAILFLATAPKSNANYTAYQQARAAAKTYGSLMPPKHILNAPTGLMKDLGYGKDYTYDHDVEDAFSGQNYFPEGMQRQSFYRPSKRGFEKDVALRMAEWEGLRKKKAKPQD